jgi:3-oxoacyl-ACP reductase-like protein
MAVKTAGAHTSAGDAMAFGEELDGRTLTDTQRALRTVARSVLKELKRAGYSQAEMVGFASELLDLVTTEIRSDEGPEA